MRGAQVDRHILVVVIVLLLFGHLMLFSATGVHASQRYGSEFYFVYRQAFASLVGLGGIWVLSRISVAVWQRMALGLMAIQILLVGATYLPHIGHRSLGATRWISIGGWLFQPSELAKITMSILLASALSKQSLHEMTRRQLLLYSIPIGILMLLILKQPDLGTTTLLALLILSLLFLAGVRLKWIIGSSVGALGLFILAILLSDYRKRRFLAFLNPWSDPQGSGFQMIQSFLSFHSGGIFGTGIGNGNSKLFYLPEVHTDFIFSLIGEELGFIGVCFTLMLYSYLFFCMFQIASKATDLFSKYLAFALSLSLCLQTIVNIAGVTGLIPIKGLPLPFLSWGRSALISNCFTIGILLNIWRQSEIIPLAKETNPESEKNRHHRWGYGWTRFSSTGHCH